MRPLNTAQRRNLMAASLRLERRIRREHALPRLIARQRLLKLLTRRDPWSWHAI
ncbi:MAG: hypothetical protein AB8G17_20475 [Gammaproteobacteria bacterium]